MIYKYDLNGDASSKTAVPLGAPAIVNVIDHAIEIDFGSGGLGGSPNTSAADGYYEVDIMLPNGQISVHHFDRLLGDVDGDGIVDQNDLNEIAATVSESSPLAGRRSPQTSPAQAQSPRSSSRSPLEQRTTSWVQAFH